MVSILQILDSKLKKWLFEEPKLVEKEILWC